MRPPSFFMVPAILLLFLPAFALGEFRASDYTPITQTELVKNQEFHSGKKYQIRDPFQFCGSDFCVQIQKTKLNTKDYYCFTVGTICAVRNYIRKDHPEAQQVLKLRKGDILTIYGTYDFMGSNYNYLVVDHVVVEKSR